MFLFNVSIGIFEDIFQIRIIELSNLLFNVVLSDEQADTKKGPVDGF